MRITALCKLPKLETILGLLLIAIFMALPAQAKDLGTIEGRVTDSETGQPVIGASVIVVGTKLGAQTGLDGRFLIRNVPPGVYSLRVTSLEFNTVTLEGIEVKANEKFDSPFVVTRKKSPNDTRVNFSDRIDFIDKVGISNKSKIGREQAAERSVADEENLRQQVGDLQTNEAGKVFNRGGQAGEVARTMPPHPQIIYQQPHIPPYCGTPWYGNDDMYFRDYGVNGFIDASRDKLSTFAADVDDASFSLTRTYLDRGELPPREAVRVEEFINHFDYNYNNPTNKTFAIYSELAPSPFRNRNVWLLSVGVKGKEISQRQRKPANLVFVIDVSGSMAYENRIELVKQALHVLVDQMTPQDRIGIVTFNTTAREILQPTSVRNRQAILSAIDRLSPGGSTNVADGLKLGYRMSGRIFENTKTNRVILLSDGVANVGNTSAEAILNQVWNEVQRGITLTSVGVGMGNYNDVLMEQLANKGNGSYAYVDDLPEANKIFYENLTGTLQVIARDVKLQVEFDPTVVQTYRLLGYENRAVADQHFRNENVDGGEIGAGHEVTALYEVTFHPHRHWSNIGKVSVRYKDPQHPDEVSEFSSTVARANRRYGFNQASDNLKLAAAASEFGEILRESYWAQPSNLPEIRRIVAELEYETESGQIAEFMRMLNTADQLMNALAER